MSDYLPAYKAFIGADGATGRARTLVRASRDYTSMIIDNPSYEATATRNGVVQPLQFTRSEVKYKANVVAMPGDELEVGDMLTAFDEHWIVVQVYGIDTLQRSGLAWQCNHLFKFQNFDATVYERWGVLDSGVYSTTKKGDEATQWLDVQFKAYLPYDVQTNKLYVDKRIAVDTIYDKNGNEILDVHQITRVDAESGSYGVNGRILILYLRSDSFNADTDNVSLGLCDYIVAGSPLPTPDDSLLTCSISGSDTIKPTGVVRQYTAAFYDSSGVVVTGITPVWSVSVPAQYTAYVSHSISSGALELSVSDYRAVGQSITISLVDSGGAYNIATKYVEVVGI